MLVLPIKKQWFDMILSGEKKEEYREIKPYWVARLVKNGYPNTVILRNGYRKDSPQITCECRLSIGQGKQEWGAEKGKEYYILTILEIIEIKNWDNPNPPKVKEAMAVAALPATPPITPIEDMQEEITKAINKQFAIGIDIGEGISRSGQSRKNTMMFGG